MKGAIEEDIDEVAAEEARERAAARLREKLSSEEVGSVNDLNCNPLNQLDFLRESVQKTSLFIAE